MNYSIKNIVFDLGGVLIDWNPRYLFTEVFENHDELEFFLSEICSPDWNEEQDGGRSLQEGTEYLLAKFPDYRSEIIMFYDEWEKMLGGPLEENVDILEKLMATRKYRIFALTNWSAETFPIALRQFDFLKKFESILVSGVERMRKPQPEFYTLMLDRFEIKPSETIFIDDNKRNVLAAEAMQIPSIHLPPGSSLKHALRDFQIII